MSRDPQRTDAELLQKVDDALCAVARDIRVLSILEWPQTVQKDFLAGWSAKSPRLPEVEYAHTDEADRLTRLEAVVRMAEALDPPLARYYCDSARSYMHVLRMLECLGSADMTQHSIAVYGRPGDALSGGAGKTSVDAARYFLDVARDFSRSHAIGEQEYCIPAGVVRERMLAGLAGVFGGSPIEIALVRGLAAKATAGAQRIRLRDATCFSEYDIEQLLQHEAFVHSLTARNGRRQPRLRALGLGAPRTTAAQEGLATFAELITGAIDMGRLQRIALRILAIDMALAGADFIEVFRFFLDAGQSESESFSSARRVFRGAPVRGGAAFTKDSVYLHGLLEVHTFFRWALQHHNLGLCRRVFAGRMTLGDVIRFSPLFADGTLAEPELLPPWMTRTTGLGGYLAFSVFANEIALDSLDSEHAFEALDR